MPDIRRNQPGHKGAMSPLMRLKTLILLVSSFAGVELAPIAGGGFVFTGPVAEVTATANRITLIREDLAAVQMELMQVMRTDPARTLLLEQREKQLKYSLRTEEIRRDESVQHHDRKHFDEPALAQGSGLGTPQS